MKENILDLCSVLHNIKHKDVITDTMYAQTVP